MHRVTPRAGLTLALVALAAALASATASADTGNGALPFIQKAPGKPTFSEQKTNYTPTSTTRTIPYWISRFTDPTNGVTYPYSMVGNADPRVGHGGGTTTVPTVIIPLAFSFASAGGYTIDGSARVAAVMASPQFQSNDYQSTATASDSSGVQLEDATMRSQFDEVGGSPYHLVLGQPTVLPTQTISVPQKQGSAFATPVGPLGLVAAEWFAPKVNELMNKLHIDPTTLPIFLVDNTYLYIGNDPFADGACCILGFHGAGKPQGNGAGATGANGNAPIQTFVFASYATRGTFDAPFIADIHALSHEIAEWADDPFVNNVVDPWLTPTAPQYGCTDLLETGDPVVGIGFNMPGNTYDNGPLADGTWHPEDEVFLPWFARESPSTSEGGRYTFMGDANPFPGFHVPATGCS
jgi:hypothetical protein